MSRVGPNPGNLVDFSNVGGEASALQGQVQSKMGEVTSLTQQLQALVAQLEAIQDPPAPGSGASKEQQTAWQNACNENAAKRTRIAGDIQQCTDKLQKAVNDLGNLQSRMPSAQANDQRKVRDAMDRAQKTMDSAAQAVSTSSRPVGEPDTAEIRNEMLKREMNRVAGRTPPPASGGGVPPVGLP